MTKADNKQLSKWKGRDDRALWMIFPNLATRS
jgi:hypothetical protein